MGTRRKRLTARAARLRRHARVRRHVRGSAQRPRLAVFRSNAHIYGQLIDDDAQHTLAAASDLEPDLRAASGANKTQRATQVGARLAERARTAGIDHVVFDRGGFRC